MNRKTAKIILSDKKEYTFSERNREDTDLASLQNDFREERMMFIQKVVSNPDNQLALLMQEMRRIYSDEELSGFVNSSPEQLKKIAYNSFKINNPDVTFEQFKPLLAEDKIKSIVKIITELEAAPEVDDKLKEDVKKKRRNQSVKK